MGFLLSKVSFTKPALSLEKQINLLVQRGMTIPDQAKAEHYLRYIGYYRLSGYWHPFQFPAGTAHPDNFRPGTDFQTILNIYIFDRRLRVLLMDAIERIEVSARAVISNTMSEAYGPHWHLSPCYFPNAAEHTNFLDRARQEAGLNPPNLNKQTLFGITQKNTNPQTHQAG